MTALNEALLSAQRAAIAAMQRAYLAGAMDVDEVSENLDSIDLLDVLQRRALLNAWAICKSLGATSEPAFSPAPRPEVVDEATQAQRDLIARLSDERGQVADMPVGMTKAQASKMIEDLKRLKVPAF